MSMTRSEQDERFEVSEVSRRGAHRARPNPLLGLLPLAALAAAVVGVIALAYVLFGRGASEPAASGDPVAAASVAATPSAVGSAPAGRASPGPSAGADPQSSPGASSASAAPVDKSIVLNFYNGSSPNVAGLSRRAANELRASGWKIGNILPWSGSPVSRTTVYYANAEQLPTARAVIKALGVGSAKQSTANAPQGMTVVISNDYTP
jgi:hypothetical protein